MLPALPYESYMNGVLEWLGVSADQMKNLMPNVANFPASQIFSKDELFLP
jgi:hypothetical protein